MIYTYEDPLTKGYSRFKLSRKQHNQLFKYRQLKWYSFLTTKYEYYISPDDIRINRFVALPNIIFATILFPFMILIHGISNIKEILNEYKRAYNQKKYGSFINEHIWKTHKDYNTITTWILNNKEHCITNKINKLRSRIELKKAIRDFIDGK